MNLILCASLVLVSAVLTTQGAAVLPQVAQERAFVNLGGRDYFFDTSTPSTWNQARNFCRTLGMFIVSVETQEENDLIVEHITNVAGLNNYWTGGNDVGRATGDYVWDATATKVIFADWHAGEPNHSRNEHYIHYWFKNGMLKWNDASDDNLSFPICEQE